MHDLATLGVVDDPQPLELRHPQSGEVLRDAADAALTIWCYGRDSETYRQTERDQQNRRLREASRGRRVALTAEAVEAEAVALLVACTARWHLVKDGAPLPHSEAAARALYSDPRYAWIREQVEGFIADRANFFGDSKPS